MDDFIWSLLYGRPFTFPNTKLFHFQAFNSLIFLIKKKSLFLFNFPNNYLHFITTFFFFFSLPTNMDMKE